MLNLAKESFIFQVMRCSSSLCSLSGSNFMFGYNNLGGSPCSKIHGVLLNLGQHLSYQLESDVEKKYSLPMCMSTTQVPINLLIIISTYQLSIYKLPINQYLSITYQLHINYLYQQPTYQLPIVLSNYEMYKDMKKLHDLDFHNNMLNFHLIVFTSEFNATQQRQKLALGIIGSLATRVGNEKHIVCESYMV